jgi:AcrR family transcriptional regulator
LVTKGGRQVVTARAIANAIGYAPGSIYNAVGDLNQVFLRVNASTLNALADELEGVVASTRSANEPSRVVLDVAERYMRFVTSHDRLWAAVLEPRLSVAPPPAWYASTRKRLAKLVDSILVPFFPNASERYRAGVSLWAALQGVAALAISGNLEFDAGQLDPIDIAHSIVRRYLSGVEQQTRKRSAGAPRRRRR